MTAPLALLQSWHELDFFLGTPDDIEFFPWSVPVSMVALALLLLMLWKARRNYMSFRELEIPAQPLGRGDVEVVIPARNEAKNIERCVRSFPNQRVVVVDDASSDGTGALAAKAGAEVVKAPPLPRGMMGKVNALMTGAKEVRSDYVLFVDADTRFDPAFAGALAAIAESEGIGLATVFLKQRCETFFEKLLLPYAFALYFTGVNAKHVQDFKKPDALANGQCMLFLRSAYEFFGGHGSVKSSVIDDVAIAAVVKRHRMNLRIFRAEKLGEVRMYDSLGAIWRGFKKNSFHFLRMNPRTGMQVMFSSVLLTSMLPLSLWMAYQEQWPFLAGFLVAPVLFFWPWYGGLFAILYLPAIYLFQLIALDGMITAIFHRKTDWKGRKI